MFVSRMQRNHFSGEPVKVNKKPKGWKHGQSSSFINSSTSFTCLRRVSRFVSFPWNDDLLRGTRITRSMNPYDGPNLLFLQLLQELSCSLRCLKPQEVINQAPRMFSLPDSTSLFGAQTSLLVHSLYELEQILDLFSRVRLLCALTLANPKTGTRLVCPFFLLSRDLDLQESSFCSVPTKTCTLVTLHRTVLLHGQKVLPARPSFRAQCAGRQHTFART